MNNVRYAVFMFLKFLTSNALLHLLKRVFFL